MGLAHKANLTLGKMTLRSATFNAASLSTMLVSSRRQQRISRFHADFHDYIARITACSPAVEDLAESFPALLFALATGFGTQSARSNAFRAVEDGQSLRACALALGLPWWTRRLPAAALSEPFEQIPGGPQFDRRIVDLIPQSEAAVGPWFRRVVHANETCGPDFALWIARHQFAATPEPESERFRHLAAWAWHSDERQTAAGRLMARPWTANLGQQSAASAVTMWRCRMDMAASLAVQPPASWISTPGLRGYQFVPLSTIDDFLCESIAMSNCLDRYADRMETGKVTLVSIRRASGPVANLELHIDTTGRIRPTIMQLKRAGNRTAGPHLWKAAHEWLAQQTGPWPQAPRRDRRPDVRKALMALWTPYLEWLPPRHASALECYLRQSTSLRSKQRATTASRSGPTAGAGTHSRPRHSRYQHARD